MAPGKKTKKKATKKTRPPATKGATRLATKVATKVTTGGATRGQQGGQQSRKPGAQRPPAKAGKPKATKRSAKARKRGFIDVTDYARRLVRAALAEDLGPKNLTGDITTDAIVPASARGEFRILAKEPMVVAGLMIAEMAFKSLDKKIIFKVLVRDGRRVKKGAVIARVSGRVAPILSAERVALNFLQRLSGVATLTSEFVKKVKGTGTRTTTTKILDTRKTTPCMRLLERYAVTVGGGVNHRLGLFDAVLIKDNHIRAVGSIAEAIQRTRKKLKSPTPIEVEAATLKEVREALSAEADIIMLDNMGLKKIKESIRLVGGKAFIEASGSITLKNVRAVALTGVDFISIGALTHSARAMDLSMEML